MAHFTVCLINDDNAEYNDRKASFVVKDSGVLEVCPDGRHITYHSPVAWLHVVEE